MGRVVVVLVLALLGTALAAGPVSSAVSSAADPVRVPRWMQPWLSVKPLTGEVVALDPGHQLGNRRHPEQVDRPVDAGGLIKPCNTTGTATDDGYAEATLTFAVASRVRARLVDLGATVRMTRDVNSDDRWGPCVDERGRFPGRVGALLMVSLHADGSLGAKNRGFHVIVPASSPVTVPSLWLARELRAALGARGVERSTYVGNGTALSRRDDLGTLNLSTVPAVMLELGNMRDPVDAAVLRSPSGQARYAAAVVAGIREFLGR